MSREPPCCAAELNNVTASCARGIVEILNDELILLLLISGLLSCIAHICRGRLISAKLDKAIRV